MTINGPRNGQINCIIPLPSSKSESNRALILNALCNNNIKLDNLSEARDTQLMLSLLHSKAETLDVKDAGTTMRFLTAFIALTTKSARILTGTERMKLRPVKPLVASLGILGGQISYLGEIGYPPIKIQPFQYSGTNKIAIPGNISSQFISALLMVAPLLPEGLLLEITTEVSSRPYIEMTLQLMQKFGVSHVWEGDFIKVEPQKYQAGAYKVESDWSAASYWYSILAMQDSGDFFLKGLKEDSLQGDKAIVGLMEQIGVNTAFKSDGIMLRKSSTTSKHLDYDFTACPDLAQTMIVLCAFKNISITFSGLESLRIKETDRIKALQQELSKFGIALFEENNKWSLQGELKLQKQAIEIETYEDHRMAMAFAPISIVQKIGIEDKNVVNKSYPGFWEDLKLAGFEII